MMKTDWSSRRFFRIFTCHANILAERITLGEMMLSKVRLCSMERSKWDKGSGS
jgi:hypothetical protein